uniref:DNA-directed RNA polymerase n=1 Tax=Boodleopsis sp. FL1161 TaxID=2364084 RepID=A0A386AZ48_9CHLO|nr:RNA polymerase b-subunit [Boodleopsis sp. FL1161]
MTILKMFFLFYKFLFFISDLLEIQRKSFYRFLNFQLKEELTEFSLILLASEKKALKKKEKNTKVDQLAVSDTSYPYSQTLNNVIVKENFLIREPKTKKKNQEMSIFLFYDNFRYTSPGLSIEESILSAKTYSCNFYVPIQLNTSTRWIFLGTLPLLTRRGHFIVNGIPRVVVNQIVRSPGVYFYRELQSIYTEIISERGPWIRVEIDKKKKIWVSLTNQKKGLAKIDFSQFFETYYPKYIDFLNSETNETYLTEIEGSEDNVQKWKNILKNFQLYGLHLKESKISRNLKNLKLYSYSLNFRIFIKCELNCQTKIFTQKFSEKLVCLPTFDEFKPIKKRKTKKTDIDDADIDDSDIDDSDIDDADIGATNLQTNDFQNLDFENTTFKNPDFLNVDNTNLNTTEFDNPEFQNIDFDNMDFDNTNFDDTELDTDTDDIDIENLNFRSTDLSFRLGNYGRINLNKKLGLSLKTKKLTPIDFLAIANILIKISVNLENFEFDDIDNLKNRKVKSIGDLLKNQLTLGFQRLQKIIKNKILKKFLIPVKFLPKSPKKKSKQNKKISVLKKIKMSFEVTKKKSKKNSKKKSKSFLIKEQEQKAFFSLISSIRTNQPISSVFKEFFNSHQLSQFLDQNNPLAEITHKRRISCLGSGGISKENAGIKIRIIHPSHYGRICPIETPEGKNAGLVNSLTTFAKINLNGFIQTPYCEIYKRHEQNQKKVVLVSVEHQKSKNISVNKNLLKTNNVFLNNFKKLKFQKGDSDFIDLATFDSRQFFSVATMCIPFVEHNDANRALMGSNMQRQALPLIRSEQPFVTTSTGYQVLSDLNDIPTSSVNGIILYVSQQKICFSGSLTFLNKKNQFQILYWPFLKKLKRKNTNKLKLVFPYFNFIKLKKQIQQNLSFISFKNHIDF